MAIPPWLTVLAWISLALAALCTLATAADEIRHPQKMWIISLVWPLTALYGGPAGLWLYWRAGRATVLDRMEHPQNHRRDSQERRQKNSPNWRQIAVSSSHCGAGCALADIVGENLVFAAGWVILGQALYAEYAVTLALAWLLGIAFQYFSIQPMKRLPPLEALAEAVKADTLSIVFFQIGMYGWMALVYFILFPKPHLYPDTAAFWLMMQVGMVLGFATTLPVNAWLLRRGIKEAMG